MKKGWEGEEREGKKDKREKLKIAAVVVSEKQSARNGLNAFVGSGFSTNFPGSIANNAF